jgi:hypothetical protein
MEKELFPRRMEIQQFRDRRYRSSSHFGLTQFSGTATQPIEINNPFGSGTCITIRAGGSFGKIRRKGG